MLRNRSGQRLNLKRQEYVEPELHHLYSGLELVELSDILQTFIPSDIVTETVREPSRGKEEKGVLFMIHNHREFRFDALDDGWKLNGNGLISPTETLTLTASIDVNLELALINQLNIDNHHYQFFNEDNMLKVRQLHELRYGGVKLHHFIAKVQAFLNIVDLLTSGAKPT